MRMPAATAYPLGPETVISSRLDNGLPSPVQIAPCAAQSVVTGSTTVTSPLESGLTTTSQPTLLGGSRRRAPFTEPPVTVNAWSRIVV